jgi:hypothetical protein
VSALAPPRCSSPNSDQAYNDIRGKTPTNNWLLVRTRSDSPRRDRLPTRSQLEYESERSNKLVLRAQGAGGLEELKQHLKDDTASFACTFALR